MAVRTTSSAVSGIVEVSSGDDLTPFIETANALVTDICSPLGYDSTRLELIERWLAAHFYSIYNVRVSQESAGSVQASYQYKVDLNLNVTMYGQQAMLLDTKGGLASLQKRVIDGAGKPNVAWMGTNYKQLQTDGVTYPL